MRTNYWIGALVALLTIFVIGILFKNNVLTFKLITDNQAFISTIKDIVFLITVIGGAVFSYYKFFKGRTFSLKADIKFDIHIFKTPEENLLHVIKVEVENIGTLSIWDPQLILKIRCYKKNGEITKETIRNWGENSEFIGKENRASVLDSGEKAYFIVNEIHSPDSWLVNYQAELKAHNNKTWQNSINIENKINIADKGL
jgi:hypothetical protein